MHWKTSRALLVGKKYKQALHEVEESEQYYQGLCENLDSTVQTQWEAEMANAQEQRTSDITAMDIFNPAVETGGFFKQAEIHHLQWNCCSPIMCRETAGTDPRGIHFPSTTGEHGLDC